MRDGTGRDPGVGIRGALTLLVLIISIFAAQRIGLVDLIGKGYRMISWALLAIFVVPIVLVSFTSRRALHAALQNRQA